MKIVTPAQMREIERRAIEEFDTPGEVLMERAGGGVAMVIRRTLETTGLVNPVIQFIAGRGQNGGDAFVAARMLKEQGYQVEVYVAARLNQISGDALVHFGRMKKAGVEPYEIATVEEWQDLYESPYTAEIIVDGILGTGLRGPARGPSAGAIRYIRERAQEALVIAIDIPSGLDAETGECEGEAVIADITATIALPKRGLVGQSAVGYVGSLEVVDIGIPPEMIDELPDNPAGEVTYLTDLKPLFKRRPRISHKGDYGHLLVIAGSRSYGGAALLCARAAMRTGAGLVTAVVPSFLQSAMITDTPEIIVWPGETNEAGALLASIVPALIEKLSTYSAIVVGPGLTVCEDTATLVAAILEHATVPVLLDADAINLYAGKAKRLKNSRAPLVITPHPGELARLLGEEIEYVQEIRMASVIRAVSLTSATVVLKGAGTLIHESKKTPRINLNGNPGMATAGSGDVLAGMIGSLLAQGFSRYDAASAGVYMHGRAGDYAALRRCQASLMASDIIEEIPFTLRDISIR